MTDVKHMKWWGWGNEGVGFHWQDKPGFADFVQYAVGLDLHTAEPVGMPSFEKMTIPKSLAGKPLLGALATIVGDGHVTTDDMDRVVHVYGKSLRDLVRIRANQVQRYPDVVVYPADEAEVQKIVDAAVAADVVIIPFGGGSNIAGSLEPRADEKRVILSLDMGRLRKVVAIDEDVGSRPHRGGSPGPRPRGAAQRQGLDDRALPGLVHPLDHRRLGRDALIGHAVRQVRRHLRHREGPPGRASGQHPRHQGQPVGLERAERARDDPRQRGPPRRHHRSHGAGASCSRQARRLRLLLPELGCRHRRHAGDRGIRRGTVDHARLGRPGDRILARHEQERHGFDKFAAGTVLPTLMKAKGWKNMENNICLSFIGFEGSEGHAKRQKKLVDKIIAKHNGLGVGTGPGVLYDQKKFDTPYLRDFLLDRGAAGDVSETAMPWSKVTQVHDAAIAAAHKAYAELGIKGWIMSHMSHSYHSGACLYFTFAFVFDKDPLGEYDHVKSACPREPSSSWSTASGEPCTERGANAALASSSVTDALLAKAGVLHISGYSILDGFGVPGARDLMARATAAEVAVSVTPGSFGYLHDFGVEPFLEAIDGAAIVFPNLAEGRMLSGQEEPNRIGAALREHFEVVVLTMGGQGLIVYEGKKHTKIEAPMIQHILDPTGAGDALAAGFLDRWVVDRDAVAAAQEGAFVAARAIMVIGARPPI